MSRPARSLLAVALAAAVLLCGRAAVGSAAQLEQLLEGQLVPSSAPALLGPITAAGRTGWECRPERAAAAAGWQDARLPAPGSR
jgi:hypothetical protein